MKKVLIYTAMFACLAGSVYGDITVKGALALDTNLLINGKLTNDDWRGVATEHKYNETYQAGTGLGLGVEYSFLNDRRNFGLDFWPENLEVLGGLNFFLPQNITDYKQKDKISPPDINGNTVINKKQSYGDNELTLQITSFYIKPRYILPLQNFGLYAGFKLSYNLIGVGGENSEELKLDNTIGYGFSLGTIVNDLWDIELGWDKIGQATQPKDGETYELQQMLMTVGYRFGQTAAKPVKEKVIKEEKVKEVKQPAAPDIFDSFFEEPKKELSAIIEEPVLEKTTAPEAYITEESIIIEETRPAAEPEIAAEAPAVAPAAAIEKTASEKAEEARLKMQERFGR